jgi:small-conductance mechanosensitive channel
MDVAWLGGVVLAATETPGVGPDDIATFWPVLRRVGWFVVGFGLVTLLGWFVFEPVISRYVRRRNQNNPTIREVVTRWVRLVVVLVGVAVGLGAAGFGYVIGDSALVIAAGTLAVGVAGQTVLGSLVSGLVLVADPKFNVGDFVEWSGGSGTIQSITLRVTRIVTPDGELVTVPNTTLTGEAVTRPYGRARHRIVEQIGVDYDDDLAAALDHMQTVAADLDVIADEPSPDVYVDSFDPDWVTCRVHYWVGEPNRRDVFEVRSTYAREVKQRLEDAGMTISPVSKRDLKGGITVEGGG